MRPKKRRAWWSMLVVVAVLAPPSAKAENDDPILGETHEEKSTQNTPFKLTSGIYRSTPSRTHGYDANLRYQSIAGNVWGGVFHGPDSATAWRAGWDRVFDLGLPRITPSVQAAQGGFVGGSILLEVGEPWFVATGYGRTNLRPYVNLNFDPNDAWTFALGRRLPTGEVLALQLIRDNRVQPGDFHLHLFWRQPLAGKERVTVDLLFKQGSVEDERIRRVGLAVTYEWSSIALRVVFDPKVNFTAENQVRVSVGWRF